MNPPRIVIYDACVLYPAPLRDLLMRLALPGLFRAHWTQRIQDEWSRNLLEQRPDLTPEKIAATRELMERALPEACLYEYEAYAVGICLPDEDDQHVLAAAIAAKAHAIITRNVRDFPASVLRPLGVAVLTPDMFIMQWATAMPEFVLQAVKEQHKSLLRPPKTWGQFVEILQRQDLTATCTFLQQ